jgi:NADH:ubiquinone oxidoreductase subunit E
MPITDRERLASEIGSVADRLGRTRSALIPILQDVKRTHHVIDDHTMQAVADALGIHPVEVHSVASFYAFLGTEKQGEFGVRLCRTISCDLAGKDAVAGQLTTDLGIDFGATTADGMFTLEWANCMGMCDQGPALLINDRVFTRVTSEEIHEILEDCRRSFGVSDPEHEEAHLL